MFFLGLAQRIPGNLPAHLLKIKDKSGFPCTDDFL